MFESCSNRRDNGKAWLKVIGGEGGWDRIFIIYPLLSPYTFSWWTNLISQTIGYLHCGLRSLELVRLMS